MSDAGVSPVTLSSLTDSSLQLQQRLFLTVMTLCVTTKLVFFFVKDYLKGYLMFSLLVLLINHRSYS